MQDRYGRGKERSVAFDFGERIHSDETRGAKQGAEHVQGCMRLFVFMCRITGIKQPTL